MSWLKPILLAALLGVATFFVVEGTANALTIPNPFASCPNPPPTPSTPGTGISGSLAPSPAASSKTAPTSDIWAAYQLPFRFSVYDPGCLVANIQSPAVEAHISTWFGNLFLGSAEVLVASGAAIHNLIANPTWLNIFSQLQHDVTHALYLDVWGPFAPLSLLAVAIIIIWEARRAQLGPAMRRSLLALGTVVLVVASTTAGGLLARDVASGELGVMSAIDSAIGGSSSTSTTGSAADLETQSLLYPAWLRGEVGSSTSSTAVTYGPQLLDGSAYTWAETPGGLPTSATTSNKASEWNSAAASIKADDPSAYSDLTGASVGRAGAGLEALIGTVVTVPFGLISDALTAASLLIVVLALMVLPVVAVFGMHQRLEGLLRGVLVATAAGLLNAVLFHTAAAIQTRATGFVFGHLVWWEALFFTALSIPILWILTRPMRRLIHMPSKDSNPAHEIEAALRRVKDGAVQVVTTAAGGAAAGPAGAVAGDVAGEWAAENQAARESRSTRKEGDATAPQSDVVEPQAASDPSGSGATAPARDRSSSRPSQAPSEPLSGSQRVNGHNEPASPRTEPYGRHGVDSVEPDATDRDPGIHSNGSHAPEPRDGSEGRPGGVREVPRDVGESPEPDDVGASLEAVHDAAVGE